MCPLTCNKASPISAAVYDIIIHDATPTAQYTLEMATAQRTRPRAVVGVPRSVATKICITSQRQRSAACNNF